MLRHLTCLVLLLCLIWPQAGRAEEYSRVTTVAVVPFVKQKGDKTVWLDKAVADLVAQKLSESSRYAVLNRDALQTIIKEMQLQQSGFVNDTQSISRVGNLAKVEVVVYGSYALDGDNITIHLELMDVAGQETRRRADIEGDMKALVTLSQQLVEKMLAGENVALTPQEKDKIAFVPTDSLSAIEHFYRGLHAYDGGDYEAATGEFFAATNQDPNYLDAQLWFARMLEQVGKDDQAVSIYLKVYERAPESVEGIDARYFAARLQARTDPAKAIQTWQALADIKPEIPEALEAAYQQAQLCRRQGDSEKAYLLYKKIDDFSEYVRKHQIAYRQKWIGEKVSALRRMMTGLKRLFRQEPAETQEDADIRYIELSTRHSRFFGWEHPLGLYREAITAMVELYRDLPASGPDGQPWPAPRGSFVVDPANPVISGDVKDKDKSLFGGDHTYMSIWKEMFYALIVPKGYEAVGIDLQITGRLPWPTPSRDFTLRVMPFPLPMTYQNTWLGVIYGQTPTTTTLNKNVSFFGRDQTLLALQLIENHSTIDRWQVRVILRKEDEQPAMPPPAAGITDTEGALLAKVRLGGDGSHSFESMPQYIQQLQSKRKLALADNGDAGLWLVGVRGELFGQETDLWSSHSTDGGRTWTAAAPMEVNSASLEFAPALVRGEDGALRLFFLSSRRGVGWEIWTSTQDPKSGRWSHPRLVPLTDFAPGGGGKGKLAENVLPYAVMQDSHGSWLLAVSARADGRLVILASDDLENWTLRGSLDGGDAASVAIGEDGSGKYYLVTADDSGQPVIHSSNDAAEWEKIGWIRGSSRTMPLYASALLKNRQAQGMNFVFSDTITGLQFVPVSPLSKDVQADLVTASGLEPYAIAPSRGTGFFTAQWKDDDIYIQHYGRFAFAENGYNNPGEIIYTERSRDSGGGTWDRIFARERYRVPDVTAVGAAPQGRAWWGIETGAMSLKGSDFLFTDVSLGFFNHDTDIIKHCGNMTWFADSMLGRPHVGYSEGDRPGSATAGKPMNFDEMQGGITAIACAGADTWFGSRGGSVLHYASDGTRHAHALPAAEQERGVAALAYDERAKRLIVAASDGAFYEMDGGGIFAKRNSFGKPVTALAFDSEGRLWAGLQAGLAGVMGRDGNILKLFGAAELPVTIRKLVPDTAGGVWAIADSYSLSPGLVHMDLKGVNVRNPPQKILRDIVDFDVADDNTVWLGTNTDGIYHYREGR